MRSNCIVVHKIIHHLVIEGVHILEKIQVSIYKLLLNGSVEPLNIGVGLGCSGVREVVFDTMLVKIEVKLT